MLGEVGVKVVVLLRGNMKIGNRKTPCELGLRRTPYGCSNSLGAQTEPRLSSTSTSLTVAKHSRWSAISFGASCKETTHDDVQIVILLNLMSKYRQPSFGLV